MPTHYIPNAPETLAQSPMNENDDVALDNSGEGCHPIPTKGCCWLSTLIMLCKRVINVVLLCAL